jgi:hypothetical protein
MTFPVNLVWSVGANRQCIVAIPSGMTREDIDEFEEAVRLQLQILRRAAAAAAEQPSLSGGNV